MPDPSVRSLAAPSGAALAEPEAGPEEPTRADEGAPPGTLSKGPVTVVPKVGNPN